LALAAGGLVGSPESMGKQNVITHLRIADRDVST
jgi:hypothetical protein